jgi:isopenicillin N synthase-like dioxygenase
MSFESIPILDLQLARDPATKADFLLSLRRALLEVGFLYISSTGIPDQLIDDVVDLGKRFFDLPPAKKLEIEMNRASSFLGMP